MDVNVLDISFNFHGKESLIHPVILSSRGEMILVDGGYPGFMPLIEAVANEHGMSLRQLTGIIITHHDIDHAGALFEIKEKYPSVKVYASEIEAPYISGQKKSLRLQQAEDLFPSLPEEQQPGAWAFQEMLKAVRPVAVEEVFSAEGVPSFLKGVRIIFTPGHMPGHISLYIEESKTLLAADAVVYENGELEIANPDFTLDLPAAIASVKKLSRLDIQKLVCYHGGVVESGIQAKLEKLVDKYHRN